MKTLTASFAAISLLVFVIIVLRLIGVDFNLAMKIIGIMTTVGGGVIIGYLHIDDKEEQECH